MQFNIHQILFVSMFNVDFSVLRKHSCGEPEVCTLPSPPLHHIGDDSQVKFEPLCASEMSHFILFYAGLIIDSCV